MATKKTVYEAPAPASDKKKALQTALAQIDKNFGKGTVMRLGDRPEMNVEAIPTGSLALDAALGIGGRGGGGVLATSCAGKRKKDGRNLIPTIFLLQTRHATRDAQRSADGGEYGDECLYHQFPYIQFLVSFHNEIRV